MQTEEEKITNVVKFYPMNAALNPDNVFEQAIGQYESVFIVGYNKEGEFDPRASLNLQQKDILWLIETFKTKMLNGDYCPEEEDE